jgi:hypothetical protein
VVTQEGRRALERAETDRAASITVNNITADNRSSVQVANASSYTTQTANVGDELQETRDFVNCTTGKLDQIQQLITTEQFKALKVDLDYLKTKLAEPKPKSSLIAQLRQGIIEGLPSAVIAMITDKIIGS